LKDTITAQTACSPFIRLNAKFIFTMNTFGKRVSDTEMSKSASGDLEITPNGEEESTAKRATAVQMAKRK